MAYDAPRPDDPSLQPPSPPPGWYPDPSGQLRWWDGYSWTATTMPQTMPQPRSDTTWAVLSHVSFLVLPVIAPLVIRLTAGKEDPFVKHHATEALNVQILFTVVWNVLIGSLIVATATANPDDVNPPALLFVAFPLAFLAGATVLGMSIRGAVQASRRVWWRYPLSIRFVRGARRSEA
ncbi:hypothetical protein GCM10009868_11210 [Terrabacter aerolatus]|uniref:DUF2510 domain-containing protein n=1 Tax=Terrabacter aerolatus TaxID=422442 RepID=A0A512D3Y1_9MICO|nr:DUF4870 domain-containing protein [Terrabacter aerolatus]GEO31162.1 hypothetical protein TAE01_29720 [Terrabacter aerolatus]